ncbi:hypothetical protein VNO78_12166 [Psophocarpus tetragonolobus]|uniref:Uncharacterized protein n=1 Tax=Psophocarpus tetragonolobus TaxID=3891 RepID=A0AAN9SVC7_PSOTE
MSTSNYVAIFAFILVFGFCGADNTIWIFDGLPKTRDTTRRTLYMTCDIGGQFQLLTGEKHSWNIRNDDLEHCNAQWGITRIGTLLSLPIILERTQKMIFWWIKEDGIFRSYNNLYWQKKPDWPHKI